MSESFKHIAGQRLTPIYKDDCADWAAGILMVSRNSATLRTGVNNGTSWAIIETPTKQLLCSGEDWLLICTVLHYTLEGIAHLPNGGPLPEVLSRQPNTYYTQIPVPLDGGFTDILATLPVEKFTKVFNAVRSVFSAAFMIKTPEQQLTSVLEQLFTEEFPTSTL